jgi:tetratricopeptide (TPR) repeat protein
MDDYRGAPMSGVAPRSLELFEKAVTQLNCYIGDPAATIDLALAESPTFAMAHALKAYMLLAGAEKALVPQAIASANRMRTLPMNDRERSHAAVLCALTCGEFNEAARRLDQILIDYPRDLVALQMGHLLDVYRGDARNLRDRVSRVLPEWSPDLPGFHAALAMHAFGLEECGDYARAEATGRRAVEINPRDGWAHHAVAHVMEMDGRPAEGMRWLRDGAPLWTVDSSLALHNWWHLALFMLENDEVEDTLCLYDASIGGAAPALVLDLVDASALLWRLRLRGVEPGNRWQALADAWSPHLQDGYYAFNDVHALLALLGAGRVDDAYRLLATMEGVKLDPSPNGIMTREIGLPLAHALMDFHNGRYERSSAALLSIRPVAHRFGGTHVQRDLIDLTLIEAATRGGNGRLVRALANERLQQKPASMLAARYRSRSAIARAA